MPTEVYFFNKIEQVRSQSEIDYVQLNSNTPYNGESDLQQTSLFEESSGFKAGKFYGTRFLQSDSEDKTVNSQILATLSLKNGILVFNTSRDFLSLKAGDISYYTPTYQSGVYYKKNVEIIREIVEGPISLRNRYTIIY